MRKKKYAIVGVSHRAYSMFMDPLLKEYKSCADFVAMLDKDLGRMKRYNESIDANIPMYGEGEFDKMISETRPDVIIVACPDALHHIYVIKALQIDIDVIVEKPLTTDIENCSDIYKAAQESKGKVIVTFNYRYQPHAFKIKEMISDDKIGQVVSVDLNWYLDTYHGASYFQRWNRLREMSGGLNIHKSCHHLDMVQWWIDQKPEEVFAYGKLNFYGPEGFHNPLSPEQIGDGRTCLTCDEKHNCKYYMRWNRQEFRSGINDSNLDEFVSESRIYKNYTNRQCIFDPQINIHDTYSATIKYDGGAFLSYTLNASVPYEGFSLGINGSKGRIEFKELHAKQRWPFPQSEYDGSITYIPMFGGREKVDVINLGGGHGGGDPLIRDELFMGVNTNSKIKCQADLKSGIDVVLTGIAINESIVKNQPIQLDILRDKVFCLDTSSVQKDSKILSI